MPSASTQLYSFPAQLGRRSTTMLAVLALHVVLAIGLIAGMTRTPKVPDPAFGPKIKWVQPKPPPPIPHINPQAPRVGTAPPPIGLIEPPIQVDLDRVTYVPPPPVAVATDDGAVPATVSGVHVLRGDRPFYPAALRRAGKEGSVAVRVRVGAAGRAELVEVAESSGFAAFDSAALEAVKRWIFAPAQTASGPISSWVTFKVTFRLTD